MNSMNSFFNRLIHRSEKIQSLLCVGLDPHRDKHSVEEITLFNRELIEATKSFAVAYKPNLAFYESYGIPGLKALEETSVQQSMTMQMLFLENGDLMQ